MVSKGEPTPNWISIVPLLVILVTNLRGHFFNLNKKGTSLLLLGSLGLVFFIELNIVSWPK